jgi:hypothetical protein
METVMVLSAPLEAGVGHRGADADDAGDGAGVDHRARLWGGLEQGAGGAQHLERADHVDRVETVEVVGGDGVHVAVPGEGGGAGVVEQGVDAAVRLRGGGDLAAILVGGDVALDQHGLGPMRRAQAGGFLGLLAAAGIVDDHGLGALGGGLDGHRATEPGGGSRHHHHEVLIRPGHGVASLLLFVGPLPSR